MYICFNQHHTTDPTWIKGANGIVTNYANLVGLKVQQIKYRAIVSVAI